MHITPLSPLTIELLTDRWLKGKSCPQIGAERGMDWREVWRIITAPTGAQIKAAIGDCRFFKR